MPSVESNGVANMWYSFDYGTVHFVSVDTETDYDAAPEENTGDSGFSFLPAGHWAPNGTYLTWLENDLKVAAAARQAGNIDYIIVGGHRPLPDFPSASFTALLNKYSVDIFFNGHGHSYASYAVGAYGANYTRSIMVGGAGCDEMPYPTDQTLSVNGEIISTDENIDMATKCNLWCNNPHVRSRFDVKKQEPCRYCDPTPLFISDQFAIGKLSLLANRTLVWELLLAPTGQVLDTVVLNPMF